LITIKNLICIGQWSTNISKEKETIFNFGDFGDQFYIILEGKVSVRVPKVVKHRQELFKFILQNIEFIDLENPNNLRINEFNEISEGLLDQQHYMMLDKLKLENKANLNFNYYMNYYFKHCVSLRSYCTDKSKSKKNYELNIFQEVVVLSNGACFGELALMNSKPRAATIVALSPTHTSYLVKRDYKAIIGKAMKKNIDSIKDFLKQICSLQHLTNNTLQKLSYYIKEVKTPRGQVVFKEGEPVDGIYLVRDGEYEKTKVYQRDLGTKIHNIK